MWLLHYDWVLMQLHIFPWIKCTYRLQRIWQSSKYSTKEVQIRKKLFNWNVYSYSTLKGNSIYIFVWLLKHNLQWCNSHKDIWNVWEIDNQIFRNLCYDPHLLQSNTPVISLMCCNAVELMCRFFWRELHFIEDSKTTNNQLS